MIYVDEVAGLVGVEIYGGVRFVAVVDVFRSIKVSACCPGSLRRILIDDFRRSCRKADQIG